MLGQNFFGCDRVEIWSNSFNFDVFMLYLKFYSFSLFEAFGGALLRLTTIHMSLYSLFLRPFERLSFGSGIYRSKNYSISKGRYLSSNWFFYNNSGTELRFNRLCVMLKRSYLKTQNLINFCLEKAGHSYSYKFSWCIIIRLRMPQSVKINEILNEAKKRQSWMS